MDRVGWMKAVQPEVLVYRILTGLVEEVHARYFAALVCLAGSSRVLVDGCLGIVAWIVDGLGKEHVGVEEQYRNIVMRFREAIEEHSHAVVEVIDSWAFDFLILVVHVWSTINWGESLEKKVPGAMQVHLLDRLERCLRRCIEMPAYEPTESSS